MCFCFLYFHSIYEGAVNVIVTYSVMIVQNLVFCTYQLYFNKFSINTDCVQHESHQLWNLVKTHSWFHSCRPVLSFIFLGFLHKTPKMGLGNGHIFQDISFFYHISNFLKSNSSKVGISTISERNACFCSAIKDMQSMQTLKTCNFQDFYFKYIFVLLLINQRLQISVSTKILSSTTVFIVF